MRRIKSPVSVLALAEALVLVLLGSYCYFLLLFIINILAFWLDVIWSFLIMSRFIVGFVSGQLIPIAMMPSFLQDSFKWLFPYWTLCAPIEILTGRQHHADFLFGIGVLVGTATLLQLIASVAWRRGLARYTGAGM